MTNSTSVQRFLCVYIVGREYVASIQIINYTFTKKIQKNTRKIPIFISFIKKNKVATLKKKYQAELKKKNVRKNQGWQPDSYYHASYYMYYGYLMIFNIPDGTIIVSIHHNGNS